MPYLLNLFYLLLLAFASPWLIIASLRYGKYREGLKQKLMGLVPVLGPSTHQRIWFHAVSVGEVNLLLPLVERLLARDPKLDVVVTTTTSTGFRVARQRFPENTVTFCPLDFSWAVRRAFDRLKPDLVVLVELEIWPNLLAMAGQRQVPVAIVNGRLSEKSSRGYKRLGPFVKSWLQRVQLVAAQSPLYAERFEEIGADANRIVCTGSMKFDGAQTDPDNPLSSRLKKLANVSDRDVVFVAGSTQHPEEEILIRAFNKLLPEFPRLRLVLVPRHPERTTDVGRLLTQRGVTWQRRSQLEQQAGRSNGNVLLVDAVGELAGWWGCADVAFVGGSLGNRGGQNMLEPSGFGVATCFGPNTRNFRDVVELLLAKEAAVVVRDADEIAGFVRRCLTDECYRQRLGARAQRVVIQHRGAVDATVELLRALLSDSRAVQRREAA